MKEAQTLAPETREIESRKEILGVSPDLALSTTIEHALDQGITARDIRLYRATPLPPRHTGEIRNREDRLPRIPGVLFDAVENLTVAPITYVFFKTWRQVSANTFNALQNGFFNTGKIWDKAAGLIIGVPLLFVLDVFLNIVNAAILSFGFFMNDLLTRLTRGTVNRGGIMAKADRIDEVADLMKDGEIFSDWP